MDTRLGLLSAAAFAGVVIGGLLIADPGVAGSLNPSGLFGDSDGDHEGYEEYDDEGGEYEEDDEEEHDEHEEDDDDDDERDGSGSTRSSEVRFARDSHDDDHEDDD